MKARLSRRGILLLLFAAAVAAASAGITSATGGAQVRAAPPGPVRAFTSFREGSVDLPQWPAVAKVVFLDLPAGKFVLSGDADFGPRGAHEAQPVCLLGGKPYLKFVVRDTGGEGFVPLSGVHESSAPARIALECAWVGGPFGGPASVFRIRLTAIQVDKLTKTVVS